MISAWEQRTQRPWQTSDTGYVIRSPGLKQFGNQTFLRIYKLSGIQQFLPDGATNGPRYQLILRLRQATESVRRTAIAHLLRPQAPPIWICLLHAAL